MLILQRCIGETICIGDDIKITILGIRGIQARIGINAPRDIPVHREEVAKRIQRERDLELADKIEAALKGEQ